MLILHFNHFFLSFPFLSFPLISSLSVLTMIYRQVLNGMNGIRMVIVGAQIL